MQQSLRLECLTNKLFKYKLTEDIFKKTTVIPEGKNHGLIMHIDWSGSMQHQLLDTLKQTYNLMWFCKKSGIPFRVYAFQSGYGYSDEDKQVVEQDENCLAVSSDFRLFEFFSSRQNKQSLEKSMQLVYTQVFAMNGYRLNYNDMVLVELLLPKQSTALVISLIP